MTLRVRSTMCAATGLLALAGAAHAVVPWTTPAGAGSFFTYSGGESDNGLFGDPVLINGGTTFAFFPNNFLSTSAGNAPPSTTDILTVTIKANAGHKFTEIKVNELGDWSILGVGSVQASGQLSITDMVNARLPAFGNLAFGPAMPISTAGSGSWTGSRTIDLASIVGPDWTEVTIRLTNNLQSSSQQGSSSLIRKTVVDGPAVTVEIVPAPGTLGALAAAGLVLARRRRR